MPLQNRVDPFGAIHAVSERGTFMGNRGIIHDPETRTLLKKRWTLPAWIICVCDFKNVRREPMGRNRASSRLSGSRLSGNNASDEMQSGAGWTELFFLDEVTALAAGHRPCFFCRRVRATDFVRCFGEAFGIEEPRAPMLDKHLHKERLASGGVPPVMAADDLAALPAGAMFSDGPGAYAIKGGTALRWSFAGYGQAVGFDGMRGKALQLLTPITTLAVLRHGYVPAWHSSAD